MKSIRFDILKNITMFTYNSEQASLLESILKNVNYINRVPYINFEKDFLQNLEKLNLSLPSFEDNEDIDFDELKKELYTCFLYINNLEDKKFILPLIKNTHHLLFTLLSTPLIKYTTFSQRKNLFKLIDFFCFYIIFSTYFNKKDFSFFVSLAEHFFSIPYGDDEVYKVKTSLEKTNFNYLDSFFYLINVYVFQFSIPENKLKLIILPMQKILNQIKIISEKVNSFQFTPLNKFYFLVSVNFYLFKIRKTFANSIYKEIINIYVFLFKIVNNKIIFLSKKINDRIEQIKNK